MQANLQENVHFACGTATELPCAQATCISTIERSVISHIHNESAVR